MVAKKYFQIVAAVARAVYIGRMTGDDLRAFRERHKLKRAALARLLQISPSRLLDYELGYTRRRIGEKGVPAPIPRVVELALEALARRDGRAEPAE